MERPSVYLVEKTDALGRAIDFFLAEKGNVLSSSDDKRLAFLAQIVFWDWEIDNLIYSYESFKERSRVWDTSGELKDALYSSGITVKARLMRAVKWSRFYEKYNYKRSVQTVAPHEILNQVIEKWNALLDLCEKHYIDPQSKNYVNLGAKILADLTKFRKKKVVSNEDGNSCESPQDSEQPEIGTD